jgi:hypothetical protein
MIDELRIGNYFEDPAGVVRLVEGFVRREDEFRICARTEMEMDEWLDYSPYYCNPIFLNSEVLKASGFIYHWHDVIPAYWTLTLYDDSPIKPIEIFVDERDNYFQLFVSGNGIGVAQPYLHQLQNLYFAISGIELNLQLG